MSYLNTRTTLLTVAALFLAALPALAADGTYTMKSGDTLWDLARNTYSDPMLYKVLGTYNSITNYYTIPVGKVIYLPDAKVLRDIKANPANATQIIADYKASQGASTAQSKALAPKGVLLYDALGALHTDDNLPSNAR